MPVTLQEIHVAASGDLSSIKPQILTDLGNGEFTSGWALNHLYREFNKRCALVGLTGIQVTPMDAGFRPLSIPAAGISNGYVQPSGDFYLQPNGSDYYLQPS